MPQATPKFRPYDSAITGKHARDWEFVRRDDLSADHPFPQSYPRSNTHNISRAPRQQTFRHMFEKPGR